MIETRTIRQQFDRANPSEVAGYAVVFNSPATVNERGRSFREVVKPGSLKYDNLKVLWGHDANNVLASTEAGTAIATVDSTGLHVRIKLPESALREREAIGRGDVDSFSFGFETLEDRWDADTRELHSIRVHEVSIVAWPAYSEAKIQSMRSVQEMRLLLAQKQALLH